MFINRYKKSNVIKDQRHFLKVKEKLELYFMEFDKTSQMILKIYLSNCKMRENKHKLVIIITNNEYTF